MFYTRTFTVAEENAIKAEVREKNRILGYNNLNENFPTRWVGRCGEITFRDYLVENNLPYTEYWSPTERDKQDFTVGTLEIDVKTVSTTCTPRNDYDCYVTESQAFRIKRFDNVINSLVFARYELSQRRCYVMGGLPAEEFLRKAIFKHAGTRSGKIILNKSIFTVQVKDLLPLEEFVK